jgi:hypothetical protein
VAATDLSVAAHGLRSACRCALSLSGYFPNSIWKSNAASQSSNNSAASSEFSGNILIPSFFSHVEITIDAKYLLSMIFLLSGQHRPITKYRTGQARQFKRCIAQDLFLPIAFFIIFPIDTSETFRYS